jgi:hypothetical protein
MMDDVEYGAVGLMSGKGNRILGHCILSTTHPIWSYLGSNPGWYSIELLLSYKTLGESAILSDLF